MSFAKQTLLESTGVSPSLFDEIATLVASGQMTRKKGLLEFKKILKYNKIDDILIEQLSVTFNNVLSEAESSDNVAKFRAALASHDDAINQLVSAVTVSYLSGSGQVKEAPLVKKEQILTLLKRAFFKSSNEFHQYADIASNMTRVGRSIAGNFTNMLAKNRDRVVKTSISPEKITLGTRTFDQKIAQADSALAGQSTPEQQSEIEATKAEAEKNKGIIDKYYNKVVSDVSAQVQTLSKQILDSMAQEILGFTAERPSDALEDFSIVDQDIENLSKFVEGKWTPDWITRVIKRIIGSGDSDVIFTKATSAAMHQRLVRDLVDKGIDNERANRAGVALYAIIKKLVTEPGPETEEIEGEEVGEIDIEGLDVSSSEIENALDGNTAAAINSRRQEIIDFGESIDVDFSGSKEVPKESKKEA